jgi:hypothetical protein
MEKGELMTHAAVPSGHRWVLLVVLVAGSIGLVFGTASAEAKPRVHVHCEGKAPRPKPRFCNFRVPYHDSFKVKKLRWKRWGSRHTVGVGRYTATGEKVRIHLKKRHLCQVAWDGHPAIMIYTRMSLKLRNWNKRLSFAIPQCDGSTY